MAAKAFTHSEWKNIRERLEADPARYGLPDRLYGSVLLGSFNIRKLGSATSRNNHTWKLLAEVCRRFDLLASFLTFIRTLFSMSFESPQMRSTRRVCYFCFALRGRKTKKFSSAGLMGL